MVIYKYQPSFSAIRKIDYILITGSLFVDKMMLSSLIIQQCGIVPLIKIMYILILCGIMTFMNKINKLSESDNPMPPISVR